MSRLPDNMPLTQSVKSNTAYMGKDDCPTPILVTIASMSWDDVEHDNEVKQKTALHFVENGVKSMILNVTNLDILLEMCPGGTVGSVAGRQIVIYTDPEVRYAGKKVGGLRIRAPRNVPQNAPQAAPDPVAHAANPAENPQPPQFDDDIPY